MKFDLKGIFSTFASTTLYEQGKGRRSISIAAAGEMEEGGKSAKPATPGRGDVQSTSPTVERKGNGTSDASASCQPLFDFNPGQMASIIRRKAMIKELAASYHAECLSYCQELLELQGKWEQELYSSRHGLAGIEVPQGQEVGNLKSALKQEMCMEVVPAPPQRVKQVSSTLSGSNEDVASGRAT